jgi:GTPase Era involved in 16S rRNA processing
MADGMSSTHGLALPSRRRNRDDTGSEGDDEHLNKRRRTANGRRGTNSDLKFEDHDDDDSDDDGNDDNGDRTPSDSMERPEHAYYDPGVAALKELCKMTGDDILSRLNSFPCNSEKTQEFRNKAQALKNFPEARPLSIGMLGASGAGKSTTVNAIQGESLTKAVAGGSACTAVVTELRGPLSGQIRNFAARIHFHPAETRRMFLREQVTNYTFYHFHLPANSGLADRSHYQDLANTSLDVFTTLFCDHPEFASKVAAIDYMNSCRQDTEEQQEELNKAVVQRMDDWCRNLLERRSVQRRSGGSQQNDNLASVSREGATGTTYVEVYQANSTRKLQKLTDLIISASLLKTIPRLWPLVEKVEMAVRNGTELAKHIVIGDFPGIGDTNQVRVTSSERALSKCDRIIIVCEAKRAITDHTVTALFQKYGELFRDKIILVITKCEQINNEQAEADKLKSDGYAFEAFDELTTKIQDLKKRKRMLKRAKQSSTSADARDNLRDQLDDVIRDRKKLRYERRVGLVKAGNRRLKDSLLSNIKGYLPEGMKVPIYTLANSDYIAQMHANDDDEDDDDDDDDDSTGPRLWKEETNVPVLLRHLHELVAPGLMDNFEDVVNTKAATFLKGLELWAYGIHVLQPDDLRKIVAHPHALIQDMFKAYRDDLDEEAQKLHVQPTAARLSEFIERGLQVLGDWSDMHWCKLRKFIRNGGKDSNAQVAKIDYNRMLFQSAIEAVVLPNWKTMIDKQKESFKKTL